MGKNKRWLVNIIHNEHYTLALRGCCYICGQPKMGGQDPPSPPKVIQKSNIYRKKTNTKIPKKYIKKIRNVSENLKKSKNLKILQEI